MNLRKLRDRIWNAIAELTAGPWRPCIFRVCGHSAYDGEARYVLGGWEVRDKHGTQFFGTSSVFKIEWRQHEPKPQPEPLEKEPMPLMEAAVLCVESAVRTRGGPEHRAVTGARAAEDLGAMWRAGDVERSPDRLLAADAVVGAVITIMLNEGNLIEKSDGLHLTDDIPF